MSDCSHSWRYNSPDDSCKWCHHCGARLLKTAHTIKSDVEGEEWRVWKIEPPLVFRSRA